MSTMASARMWAVCAGIAVLGMPPVAVRAALVAGQTSAPEVLRANLEVDTSATGTGGPVIQRRIEERASVVMRERAVLAGTEDSPTLRVVVSEQAGRDPGYGLELSLTRAGAKEPAHSRSVVCSLCTETELVAKAEAEIGAMIPLLEGLGEEPATSATPDPTPDPTQTASDPVDPTGSSDAGPRPKDASGRAMSRAGIGLLAVGGVAIGVGVGLAVAPPRVNASDPIYVTSTRSPGLAVLASGAAVTVVGVVLTALGAKRRRTASAHAASVSPLMGRGQLGIAVGGRF
jgi:hypothetical protein